MIKPGTILPCDRLSDEGYKIVAVIGYANDWAAYKWPTDRSDDDVARNGDKLFTNEAKEYFPELKLPYRR